MADVRELSITLPLPDAILSPNAGRVGDWRGRAKAKAGHRNIANWLAYAALVGQPTPPPFFPTGRVRITGLVYLPKGGRRRDDDNMKASCKAYLDGFTDAKIWQDDKQARWGDIEYAEERRNPGQIVLTLREEASDGA